MTRRMGASCRPWLTEASYSTTVLSTSSRVRSLPAMPAEQTILSDGAFRYEVLEGWAKLPPELDLVEVAAVAVDVSDTVFLFTRGEHPLIALDRDGNVLRTFGHGVFKHPHGLHIGPD